MFIICPLTALLKFLFATLAIDWGKNSFWKASKLIALELWGGSKLVSHHNEDEGKKVPCHIFFHMAVRIFFHTQVHMHMAVHMRMAGKGTFHAVMCILFDT